ncbi:MAG TPA: AMP-binding protein [Bordetella sp.]
MASHNLVHHLYGGRTPDSIAISRPGHAPLSTAELRDGVGRYAACLEQLGLRRGDRVSLKLAKSVDALMLAHGCVQLGAIIHPISTDYTLEETEYLLNDVQPSLIVCETAELERLRAIAPAGTQLQDLGQDGHGGLRGMLRETAPRRDIEPVAPDDIAAILYTSGTTGRPKGAQITHRNLTECAQALVSAWQITARDRLLHFLPMSHAHGLLTAVNTTLVGGAALLFLERFDLKMVIAALKDTTVMLGVPTHYARLMREPVFAASLPADFRLAISGSAPLPLELAQAFSSATGYDLYQRYGATETSIVAAVPADRENRVGWVGWPLPGVQVRVQCDDGAHHGRAATGSLETRGHNVFSGYWRRPEADSEAFTDDGWFITGDIAEIDEQGCVRILGRKKEIIISGGLNVYPLEVENAIVSLPGIAEAAVFGVPHPDFGEAGVAAVRLEPDGELDETAVAQALRGKLAPYKIPKRFVAVEQIPSNGNGKISKTELRERFRNMFSDPAASGRTSYNSHKE